MFIWWLSRSLPDFFQLVWVFFKDSILFVFNASQISFHGKRRMAHKRKKACALNEKIIGGTKINRKTESVIMSAILTHENFYEKIWLSSDLNENI